MAVSSGGGKKSGVVVPMWKLFLIALPQLGVNVLWSFIVPNSAPYMKHLGAPAALATLNNVAGPITGFFTGPLAGAYSDSCTLKMGRRRPVILFGLISFAIAGLIFSGAEHVLGDNGIWLAAPMYWVLDVTINIMQTPHRALAADFASEEQQFLVQIMFVFIGGCGNFVGFSIMMIYDVPIDHMLELMGIIFALNLVLVGMQYIVAKEIPIEKSEALESKGCCGPLSGLGDAISHPVMKHLAFIQSMVWVGLMCWVAYGGQWFANSVFEGDENAPEGSVKKQNYADGMQEFAFGGQVKSVVSLFFTLVIIFIMSNTSIRPRLIYAPTIFIGATASLLAAMVVGHNGNFAVICMTMAEITCVGCFSVPYGMVASMNERAAREGKQVSTALQMALLNCCVTVGQQVCTMFLAGIESWIALDKALLIGFMMAGVAFIVAGVATLFLDDSAGDDEAVVTTTDEENTSEEETAGQTTTDGEYTSVPAC